MDVIMNFFAGLDFEATANFLSDASKHNLVDWTLKITIVWVIMGRKVNARFAEFYATMTAHFTQIQNSFAEMVGEMRELKESVTKDLSKHSQMLGSLSTEVNEVKTRVTKLETKEN